MTNPPADDSAFGEIAYDRSGSGPPLLLVHGLGSDRQVWDPVTAALRERFDVIRVDLPGHGRSDRMVPGLDASASGLARRLGEFLDHLDLATVAVAGSSMGGWIALDLAAQRRAASVTAFAPAGLWPDSVRPIIPFANRWAAKLMAPLAPALLHVDALRSIGFWSTSVHAVDLDPALTIHATRSLARSSGWAAVLASTYGRRCDVRDIPVSVPVTVVWGDRDRILPAAHCQDPTGLPPHARWVRLRDCGHVPMWDQGFESVRLIEATSRTAATHRHSA